jgi:hypothetical protein
MQMTNDEVQEYQVEFLFWEECDREIYFLETSDGL